MKKRSLSKKLNVTVAQVVMEEREKRRMSQTELARRSGVNRCLINYLENGTKVQGVDLLARVLKPFKKKIVFSIS